jgi:hypothetical protein
MGGSSRNHQAAPSKQGYFSKPNLAEQRWLPVRKKIRREAGKDRGVSKDKATKDTGDMAPPDNLDTRTTTFILRSDRAFAL